MKIKKNILLIALAFFFIACEEVVVVDLNESKERLVVNASLNWYRNFPENELESGNTQTITLTETAAYYDNEVKEASGAIVTVTNNNTNELFSFIEEDNSGTYNCTNFKPILNNTYTLNIDYNNENYKAEETLLEAPVIDSIQQVLGGVFREDAIVLHVYYKDNADFENYYYFDFFTSISNRKDLTIAEDQFTNGNSTFQLLGYFGDDDRTIEIGDVFYIKFYAISNQYYHFLDILTYQIYSMGVFDPPSAEVKGNIINTINEENYPYGYFRIAQGNKAIVTINEEDLIDNN